ncbi:hypothetical protein FPV67DRAFT_1703758 [Lyophyllum atratum]|nr:hypothetical protein FPV67DRAFT_1703758 [Lyophyllum atratum]
MAPTLLSTPFIHSTAPPTSPELQVPNVFVIPPDEDDSPPWCFFDAADAPTHLSTAPDIPFLHGALSIYQTEPQSPVFHRDPGPFPSHNPVAMPWKSPETRSIMDVLMNDDYLESDDEMELELDHQVFNSRGRAAGNDSEVVEVIKVRRHAERIEDHARIPTLPPKSSKSFKSRASKAFRSLRNVGKGSLRAKPKAQDIFSSSPVEDLEPELPPRSKTPTVSRHGSAIFSQIFSPPPTLQSRSSVSSFDAVRPSPKSPPLAGRYPSSLYNHPSSDDCPGPSLASCSSLNFDDQDLRSPSPTPSTQTKSNRRRFSVMSLQRIFSFSQADDFSDITPSSMSRDSSGPSTSSSSGPDTPTEESTPLPLHFGHEDHGLLSQKRSATAVPALGQGDISFEMRLDSLHFESLSFDADRF